MKEKMKSSAFFPVCLFPVLWLSFWTVSCATAPPGGDMQTGPESGGIPSSLPGGQKEYAQEEKPARDPLLCTFTGDIMAHTVNHHMDDYADIYRHIQAFLQSDDLTFANFETPAADSLPLSSYPRFNVHGGYVRAAAESGCDVFSLANNHANDQGIPGIRETREVFSALQASGKITAFSGLRETPEETMRPVCITVNGWRVLFFAVTQILNSHDKAAQLVYYIPPGENGRAALEENLRRMREENPCDLFVLSLHTNEPEYVISAAEEKRNWFVRLVRECGVDIVWAHHPHVCQEWELVERVTETGEAARPGFVMYSAGNLISGQRWNLNTENPAAPREYTGDSFLFRVTVSEDTLGVIPVPVTNYRNPSAAAGSAEGSLTIRPFHRAFIRSLPAHQQPYYSERLSLMREFLRHGNRVRLDVPDAADPPESGAAAGAGTES